MAESAFVNDHMTFSGEVKRQPGVHPGATFTYRPATYGVRAEFNATVSGEARAAVAARILSRQVETVRFGDDPKQWKLTPDQAATLHADLFGSIFEFVMGYVGPVVKEDVEKNS